MVNRRVGIHDGVVRGGESRPSGGAEYLVPLPLQVEIEGIADALVGVVRIRWSWFGEIMFPPLVNSRGSRGWWV